MISDLELCSIVAATYGIALPKGRPLPVWDHWIEDRETYGVAAGVIKVNGYNVIAFRGSVTLADWWHDAISEIPIHVRGLGDVPIGFHAGVNDAYARLTKVLDGDPVIMVGHSLGCDHAAQICGLFVVNGGLVPERLVQFAPPRPGMMTLKYVLSIVPQAAYQEPLDIVPTVPTDPPYVHTCPITILPKRIVYTDNNPLFTPHHIQNIYAGLEAYTKRKVI